jgi:hypothetical protein
LIAGSVQTLGGTVSVSSSSSSNANLISIEGSIETQGGAVSVTANSSTINVGDTAGATIDTSNTESAGPAIDYAAGAITLTAHYQHWDHGVGSSGNHVECPRHRRRPALGNDHADRDEL